MTTYLSLFTGAGGFDLGADQAGWNNTGQIEINKLCRSVLTRHWPNIPKWGNIQTFHPNTPADVIIGGFPCQDVSIAGERLGLQNGTRSSLYTEILRIIKEMRQQTDNLYPKWVILENVRGILTIDDGKGFRTLLNGLAEHGAIFIDWTMLDSQFFGTPQRRQRVFIAACFDNRTTPIGPGSIFPVAQSSKRNPNKREGINSSPSKDCFDADTDSHAFVRYSYGKYGYGIGTVMAAARGDENLLIANGVVRRFTPLECERLQTWPDNHTLLGAEGSIMPDKARYRMIGNGVTASVAKWVCEQVQHAGVTYGNW